MVKKQSSPEEKNVKGKKGSEEKIIIM